MKQRILVLATAALATGLFIGNSSVEAATKKHLIIVHASDNTGQGTITVDKGKLHPVPSIDATAMECSKAVCGASYAVGTRVTLTAVAAEGSTFTGWGGDCSGTAPTCTVRMSRSLDAMAHFSK
ncbi:MAG: hypothetical protein ABI672_11105 [Vicinamibacteria bacterium]